MKNFGEKKVEEEKLIRATEDFRRGSAEAFHILYSHYSQKVYRFCLRMLGSKEKAEDAFQETFIKVFENAKSFRSDNFGPWLFTIARHVCLNMIRLEKPYQEVNDNSLKLSYVNNSDFGLKDFVQRAIMQLPISLREALLLREYEEYSYEEIARILDIGISLAKIRVHRARLLLKKLLEPIAKEYYGNR
ncbi:MAG: RNA polymerase sigma factor [Ignavibacteria bacterium]|nr:RNA polymerase sigma factor [Ignavibacteria bacterium]